jgi:hypothetical protein
LLFADKKHMVDSTVDDLIQLVISGSGDFSFSLEGQTYSYEPSARKFITEPPEVAPDALFARSLANLGLGHAAAVSGVEQQA